MTRKRHGGISEAEAVLSRVIPVLETYDSTIDDHERWDPLVRRYHRAFVDLLTHGPLRCDDAVTREVGAHPAMRFDEVVNLRAELLQLLRSTVRQRTVGPLTSPISTEGQVTFAVRLVDDRASIDAQADTRSLVILQTVLLLHEVGLDNVQKCSAPDCQRLFVKVYRREFCSVQCQKRINSRKQRQNAREQRERLARRRRERRRKRAIR